MRRGAMFSLFQSPSKTEEEVLMRFGLGVDSGVLSWVSSEDSDVADDDDDSPGASRLPSTVLRCERSCMTVAAMWGEV